MANAVIQINGSKYDEVEISSGGSITYLLPSTIYGSWYGDEDKLLCTCIHTLNKPTGLDSYTLDKTVNSQEYQKYHYRSKTTGITGWYVTCTQMGETVYEGNKGTYTEMTINNLVYDRIAYVNLTSPAGGTESTEGAYYGSAWWVNQTYTLDNTYTITGYHQNNYKGVGTSIFPGTSGHTHYAAPGTEFSTRELNKGDSSWFPFENVTWTPQGYTLNTYKVIFNANGGSGTMEDQDFTYNTAQNLSTNTFTKSGSVFKGWGTSASSTSVSYTDEQEVINLTAENNGVVNLYAIWEDYYTVNWASTIPSIVSVIANPIGTYPSIQSANRGQFIPGSSVTFTAQFSSSLTQIEENKSYKDNNKYYKFNKWKWENSSDISNNNPVTININRSGTVLADIGQGDLVTYTLGTNYGQAKINNKIATVGSSSASVKLAPGLEYITLEAMADDSNITFVHWEDENGTVLSSDPTYTFLAGAITSFWAIYSINGKQAYVLVPNDFQAIAQPVYIKNGLITENNTRFMSIKYPEFVDWEEVEQITGKKPKKGDFYYMIINEAVL